MTDDRLPAALEAAGLVRRAATNGDFATIIKKGDPDRGALLLVVSSRGRHVACLERVLSLETGYRWQVVGPGESASSTEIDDFLSKRTRFDADLWAIELDIAEAERFIAETTTLG
ncbi:MAG: DUF1491 family protein [Sphingomicrobium sp.]